MLAAVGISYGQTSMGGMRSSHSHSEVGDEVGHATDNAQKIIKAQTSALWVKLFSNALQNLGRRNDQKQNSSGSALLQPWVGMFQ